MPRYLHLPLKILALIGGIISLLAIMFSIPANNPFLQSGGGIPGFHYAIERITLYTSAITSGIETVLIGSLGYSRVISRKWGIIGVCLFGTIFLITNMLIYKVSLR